MGVPPSVGMDHILPSAFVTNSRQSDAPCFPGYTCTSDAMKSPLAVRLPIPFTFAPYGTSLREISRPSGPKIDTCSASAIGATMPLSFFSRMTRALSITSITVPCIVAVSGSVTVGDAVAVACGVGVGVGGSGVAVGRFVGAFWTSVGVATAFACGATTVTLSPMQPLKRATAIIITTTIIDRFIFAPSFTRLPIDGAEIVLVGPHVHRPERFVEEPAYHRREHFLLYELSPGSAQFPAHGCVALPLEVEPCTYAQIEHERQNDCQHRLSFHFSSSAMSRFRVIAVRRAASRSDAARRRTRRRSSSA